MKKTISPFKHRTVQLSVVKRIKHVILHRTDEAAANRMDALSALMFRAILLLGVPYFLFVLWTFIHMTH
ncbi:MAG: hypothetical protein ABF868_02730 [Sporolactobacillus sp.]